ncbi:hypothetical protein HY250_01010 [Candidatus Azambacteria bacterium]|nr:hypothetical protein [Candidatus Azambacteria bacterium]
MARRGRGEEKKEEGKKQQTLLEVAIAALAGEKGEKPEEAAKSFLDFWQRKEGESVASAQNILKAIGTIVGYSMYRHVDPIPDSKVDNAAVFGAAAVLLALLVIPRSNALGGRFPQFESVMIQGIKEFTPEEKEKILEFIRNLSNWQEKRLINLLRVVNQEGKTIFDPSILKTEEMRNLLRKYIGDEPGIRKDVDKTAAEVKRFFSDHWPSVKNGYHTADQKTAGALRTFRGWFNSKGVRR